VKNSERVLIEAPFSHQIVTEGIPKIISGVMDLVFKETDGWVIADYKTDKVNGNLEDLISYYKPQIEMYSQYWVEMTGEKVKERGIYFVDIQKWINI